VCEIRVKKTGLDYEKEQLHILKISLESSSGLVNMDASTTTIRVIVTDANDNSPQFVYPAGHSAIIASAPAYYATVSRSAQLESYLVTVKVPT